jgi:PAS domain S-box-containing protein
MTEKNTRSGQAANMRKQAEEIARKKAIKSPKNMEAMSPEKTRQMLHELRVYQVELEMQNEELRRDQAELEASRSRYFELYDLAPVGYITLGKKGLILEANLTAATLLEVARGALVNQPLSRFILPKDHDSYYLHLRQLFETNVPQVCELRMVKKGAASFWVRIEATAAQNADGAVVYGAVMSVITDRKRAEKAVREDEEKHRLLIENSHDIIYTLTPEGVFSFVSPAWTALLGHPVSQVDGHPFQPFVHPDDIAGCMAWLKKVVETGQRQEGIEYRVRHIDGSWCWHTSSAVPLRDEAGMVAGYYGIARDITERKRTEEALRESEERYRTVLDEMEEGYQEVNLEGKFTFFNDAFLKIFGYSAGEMMGKHYSLYAVDGEIAKNVYRAYNQMYKTGIPIKSLEWDIIRKDGARRTIEFYASTLRDSNDRPIGFRGIVRDITERKQTENALRKSEERYRNIYEDAILGIYQATPEGRFISANPAFARMAGYNSPEELIDTIKDIQLQFYVNSEDRQRFIEIITANGTIEGFGSECYKKDRSIFWILVNARAVKDELGRIMYYEGIVTDVTQRRQAEEENRRLGERLQRSEKMEALGTMAGGVAHDLNNILGVLSGYSELLLLEIPEGHRCRGYAEKILQSTEKGAAIIDDLLTLARRGVSVSHVINLNSVVSGFLKAPVFKNIKDYHPRVTFRTECDNNLLNIKGSPVHLEKTLMNLVSNAAESIPGKGDVTIRTESRYLDKAISGYDRVREGDYAVLAVSDTGMGIPAENREKIFEPFYTKKTMGRSGTGLGLAIVWGTLKDHNGYIDIQTEVGRGTTFTLYFPVTRNEVIAPQQKVPAERYIGKGESVLVVDDIAEQRDIAARLLTKLGYEVHSVSSGEEAVEYLKGNKADILVLDMIMEPGSDGLETYERVLEINPKQKAIIVSGFSETDRVKKAQKLGAGAYVKKPYVMEKIGAAIREELNR